MVLDFLDRYAAEYAPHHEGAWCYEDGCIYRGLACLYVATRKDRWLDHLVRLVDARIGQNPRLPGYDPNAYNIDNIQPGQALLSLHEITGDDRYLRVADILADQLATHPRTRSGVYWHKLRYPWQVWLDGLYMGHPFQIGYGLRIGKDALVEDSLRQIDTALGMAFVPQSGLYAHATDEARKQKWADPDTGHSRAHWARALGWLCMALVDVASLVGKDRFQPLEARARDLLARIAGLRQADGLWLQVIDRPDLKGNYQETSASSMFVYALLRGGRLGLCDEPVNGLVDTLTERAVSQDAAGRSQMPDICEVAGLGMYQGRFRDGSAEYYLSERRVANDAKGVGPLMMAIAASLES